MTTEHTKSGGYPEAESTPGGAAREGTARAAGAGAGQQDDLAGLSAEGLKGKVREARETAQRNWQHFLHSAADLENFKKQAARDRQDAVERTRRQMLGLVLIVLDNLERALAFADAQDRKSTRLNSSHGYISYAVFCLKKKQHAEVCTAFNKIGHPHHLCTSST